MKKNQLVIVALALLAAACSPKVEERGYVKNADWASVTPGQTTKDELIAAFGSPSSIADFGEETWYYIHSRKETVAFLAPEIADQGVVRVRFDENGVVSQVENYTKEQAKDYVMNYGKHTPPTGETK